MKFDFPTHRSGDTWNGINSITITSSGIPINLTDCDIYIQFRSAYNLASPVVLTISTETDTIEITNEAQGIIKIPPQIINIPVGLYRYDLQVDFPNNDSKTFLEGTFKIVPGITTPDIYQTSTVNSRYNSILINNLINTVSANSAINWNYQGTDIKVLTGKWEYLYNFVQYSSSSWPTDPLVASLSTNWNDAYILSLELSSILDSVYSSVNYTSADWNSVYADVSQTSADWNSVYSTVQTSSALEWKNKPEWDSVYTTVLESSSINFPKYLYIYTSNNSITGTSLVGTYERLSYIYAPSKPEGYPTFYYSKLTTYADLNITQDLRYLKFNPLLARWELSDEENIGNITYTTYAYHTGVNVSNIPTYDWDVISDIKIIPVDHSYKVASYNAEGIEYLSLLSDSVYSTVQTSSATEWKNKPEWDSVYSDVSQTSGEWNSVYSDVSQTSAEWNSVYSDVSQTSGEWNSVYSDVSQTSAEWNSVYSDVSQTSAEWNLVYSDVSQTSAEWDSVYSDVSQTSAEWNSVYSDVSQTSAEWNSVYSDVSQTSGEWDSVYSDVSQTSAEWNSVYSDVSQTSAEWNSVYSDVSQTSAEWNSVYSDVSQTSGEWDSVYTDVSQTSAEWNSVYSDVSQTSAEWDSVYTNVLQNSGNWLSNNALIQEYFDDFITLGAFSTLPHALLYKASVGGGVYVAPEDTKQGVLILNTNPLSTPNQRAGLSSGLTIHLGQGTEYRLIFSAKRGINTFSDLVSGRFDMGFHDQIGTNNEEPSHGCFFRSKNGYDWQAVTVTSATPEQSTDINILNDEIWKVFEIFVNQDASIVNFYVNTNLVATHTNSIPNQNGNQTAIGYRCFRQSPDPLNVELKLDWQYLSTKRQNKLW